MKLFATLALAGLASALELEQNYLAQVAEVDGDVTHPDDGTDPNTPTILDRTASTKKIGKLSYQVFFDNEVDGMDSPFPEGEACGASFDGLKHVCCFRWTVWQPFLATTGTERYATHVAHNCPVINDYGADFEHFAFTVSGEGSSSDHDYTLVHWEVRDNAVRTGDEFAFQLNNFSHASHNHMAIFWAIDTFDSAAWSYAYSTGTGAAA